LNVQFGQKVTLFDFTTFYGKLGSALGGSGLGGGSRLQYDSQSIQNDPSVRASTLMALRAEPAKALLDKAVNARENAFFAKYVNSDAVITLWSRLYDVFPTADSKLGRLATLQSLAQEQSDALSAAYIADGRIDVVKTTNSVLVSTTQSTEESQQSGTSTQTGQTEEEGITQGGDEHFALNPLPPGGVPGPTTLSGDNKENVTLQISSSGASGTTSETSHRTGQATQSQTITNTDYGYRHPFVEFGAQYQRAGTLGSCV
jgi:hypothetical protein